MTDDLNNALRGLANKWARRAQESARDSKAGDGDPERIAYQRGVAEGYYKAATELADLINTLPASPVRPSAGAPSGSQEGKPNPNAGGRWGVTSGNAPASSGPPSLTPTPPPSAARPDADTPPSPPAGRPAQPAAAAAQWLPMEISEVLSMLKYAGSIPRDIIPRPDNSFLAIFSRWENLTPAQRQAQVQKADHRLVIVESGVTKDTRDPYLIIAFKP